jgi:quercetin dioxygenase-like cupin family protein
MWSQAPFNTQPWLQGGHPLEQKKTAAPGMTLLRFEAGFADPNWCPRSHVLFVLEGDLEVEFPQTRTTVPAGEAIHIPPGCEHRVRTLGDRPVTLFALSELEQFAG